MDLTGLSTEELTTLLNQVNDALRISIEADSQEQYQRRIDIGDAIASLEALLGPEDAVAGTDSIRAVRQFTSQQMADNPELAFPLIFLGMEILTSTTLNLAKVVSSLD